jgi:hypothetical protein
LKCHCIEKLGRRPYSRLAVARVPFLNFLERDSLMKLNEVLMFLLWGTFYAFFEVRLFERSPPYSGIIKTSFYFMRLPL